ELRTRPGRGVAERRRAENARYAFEEGSARVKSVERRQELGVRRAHDADLTAEVKPDFDPDLRIERIDACDVDRRRPAFGAQWQSEQALAQARGQTAGELGVGTHLVHERRLGSRKLALHEQREGRSA